MQRRLALLLILLAVPLYAHNGAVAIAVPVEGIVVDGDLSDWPEGMVEYPIAWIHPTAYRSSPPDGPADFEAQFRVGYAPETNTLLLAIVVVDDQNIVDLENPHFDHQDLCEVYIDGNHSGGLTEGVGEAQQYVMVAGEGRFSEAISTNPGLPMGDAQTAGVTAHWKRVGSTTTYEWSIPLFYEYPDRALHIESGMVIGFDVVVVDADGEELGNWIAWGPSADKSTDAGAIGSLLLTDDPRMAKVRGRVIWEDPVEGGDLGMITAQSTELGAATLDTRADSSGQYTLTLPAGSYRISAGYRGYATTFDTLRIVAGEDRELSPAHFAQPPPGWRIKAGTGTLIGDVVPRSIPAGAGYRREDFRTYGLSDGLPGSFVLALHRDRAGNIWLGTEGGGIARFDGTSFDVIDVSHGLEAGNVGVIMEDHEGNIWFSHAHQGRVGRGLCRYGAGLVRCFDTGDGILSNRVLGLAVGNEGAVWFATSRGASSYQDGYFTNYTTRDGLPEGAVSAVDVGQDGDVWFAVYRSPEESFASRFDGYRFENMKLPLEGVATVFVDESGDVWFGTWYQGVTRYDGKDWTTYSRADEGMMGANTIVQSEDGTLWFGQDGGGLYRLDGSNFERITVDQGLGNRVVYSLALDERGGLWCGTAGGLSRYHGSQLTVYGDDAFPGATQTNGFAQGSDGALWFATAAGLTRLGEGTFTTYALADGLVNEQIEAVLAARDGTIWIGGGIDVGWVMSYDGQSFQSHTRTDGQPLTGVSWIIEDDDGQIWFTTRDTPLLRLDGPSLTQVVEGSVLSGVNDVATDPEGGLWLAAERGDSTIAFFSDSLQKKVHLSTNRRSARSMAVDEGGQIWAGTWGAGVATLSHGDIHFLTTADGLTGNWVNDTMVDSRGRLWVAVFGGGVAVYDGVVIQNLSERDGLPSSTARRLFEDREGAIWIATERGVVRYHPPQQRPGVEITDVVTDQRLGQVRIADVPATQELIRISFRASDLGAVSGRTVYQYRMTPIDSTWHQTRREELDFTDLPVGDYEFQVKAVDHALNYSEPAAVKISIHTPYADYARNGVLTLSLIALVATGGYAVRRRHERDLARENLLREHEDELQSARKMQMSLMPKGPPAAPGLAIAGRCQTANHVGGDLYQYYEDGDRLGIAMADVTGHAMEAAIPVVMFSGILDKQMEFTGTLQERFIALNRSLCRSLDGQKFICFTMAEIEDKTLRLASCGNPYPLHFHNGDVTELQVDGYPLGVREHSIYDTIETQLSEGDYLVMYSDGIPETVNESEELFGYERTMETVRDACAEGVSAEDLVERLMGAARAFAGEAAQEDDMTCVVVRVEV